MWRPLFTSLSLLGLAAAAVLAPADRAVLPGLITEYRADAQSVEEAWRLPWSERRNGRTEALTDAWLARLDGVAFEELAHGDQVDWLLLRHALLREKAELARERRQLAEMEGLLPFRPAILKLEEARLERRRVNAEAAAGELAALLPVLESTRKDLEAQLKKEGARPSPVLALRAAGAVEALRTVLAEWYQFHDGFQPEFAWWVRQPQGKVAEALEQYGKFLREEVAGQKGKPEDPLVGDPLGAEALAEAIRLECLPYTAEELIAIGEREFAWCEEQMRAVAAEMQTDRAGVLTKVKAAHVPPGEQDALVAAEAARAIAFLKQQDLVSIPPLCEETWRLRMLGPEQQKTLPYAVYSRPAVMVAYAAEGMPHEEKLMSMRGNNRHFTRIVTPHELIPGHHLQRFAADRSRAWRGMFFTPFYVEGWALHWEMLLWDRGYAESPEDRAGMLFWRMHRCARIIVSLKFHLGRMSPQEMVDFLVDRVGHERMGATSEVRRYINGSYGPLYQAAYMLGGLQLRALHRELRSMGDRAFHDAVLAQNMMPIELLRAALTGAPLSRDWKSTWRFAD